MLWNKLNFYENIPIQSSSFCFEFFTFSVLKYNKHDDSQGRI